MVQNKIKQYQKMVYEYAGDLRDVRVAGLFVFLVVVLLISWSGIKVIDTNFSLQKQITQLQQQDSLQGLEDNNLKLQNQYFNTNQYLDITARQEFGLAAPGEKMLIVPTNVAMAHTANIPSLDQQTKAATVNHQPAYQRNFQSWMNFFLHRQTS